MSIIRLLGAACCSTLAACGTTIPSQRDWPNDTALDVETMNNVLARSIVCELSYAVTRAIQNDLHQVRYRRSHRRYSSFLDDWGVEVATDLTASESSGINPTGLWAPVSPLSAVFTLSGGLSAGSVATNDYKYNVFYPLAALYKPAVFFDKTNRPCRDPRGDQEGSPLVDIDLKLLPLLETRIQSVQLGLADMPGGKNVVDGEKNVLTQTVSIKQSLSGGLNPSWRFTTGAVNNSGTLLSAGRERTHQVVLTFGKLAPGGQRLMPIAESTHLNEQLKAGLGNTRVNQ